MTGLLAKTQYVLNGAVTAYVIVLKAPVVLSADITMIEGNSIPTFRTSRVISTLKTL